MDQKHAAAFAAGLLLAVALGFALGATIYAETSGTTHWSAPNGPNVTITDTPISNDVPIQDGVVDLGNISFRSSGNTYVEVTSVEGEWTNISTIDVTPNMTVDVSDKQTVELADYLDGFSYKNVSLENGDIDAVVDAASVFGIGGRVGLYNLTDNTEVHAYNHTSAELIDEDDTGASGSPAWFEFELHEGPVTFKRSTGAPALSNASPSGGTRVTSAPELEIDAGDVDLPYDNVTVDFYVDGSYAGSDHLKQNGTASVDSSTAAGGEHTWYAEATDDYGDTTTSSTFSYETPDELVIREELENATGGHSLIDNVSVDVEFYFDRDDTADLIVSRNTTDGSVNMTGLPADESFVVVARGDGYYNRRIFVESLFEQQTVYLLNSTESVAQPTFTLTDFTGDFPRDVAVLKIQKSINETWKTVEGDFFGAANEVPSQLDFNERHQLILYNSITGEERDLGPYTPSGTYVVDLEVHNDETVKRETRLPSVTYRPSIPRLLDQQGTEVTAEVDSREADLASYTVRALLSNGTLLYDNSFNGPDGQDVGLSLDLEGAAGQELIVWANWTTTDGTSMNTSEVYDIDEYNPNQYSLLSVLMDAPMGGPTPSPLSIFITIVGALLATGYAATRMGTGGAGLAGLAVVSTGALLGFVPWNWVIAGGLAWAVLVGVRNRL